MFCQKHMPQYKTVCKKPSAALSEIKSFADCLPDCILAFLACTVSSSLLTGTVTCRQHCDLNQMYAMVLMAALLLADK